MRRIETDEGPRYEVQGILYTEAEFDAKFLPRGDAPETNALCPWKPLSSDALAVHPKQIKEAIEDAKKKGLGEVEFRADGRPVFRSRTARNAYLRAYGYFSKSAGYGDVADGTYRGRKPELDDIVAPETVALMYAAARQGEKRK